MFVDLVFLGDFCNLDCIYCSAGATRWRQLGRELEAIRPGGASVRVDLERLERSLLDLVDRLGGAGVIGLKLSGGEIFVKPGLAERVIDQACREIEQVQVLTNATRIDGLLRLLRRHENLHLQVSLDGETAETNAARSRFPERTRAVVENVRALSAVAPLEVNVVLTRWNTASFVDFLGFLQTLPGDVIAYPFPVRTSVSPHVPAERVWEEANHQPGPFLPRAADEPSLAATEEHLRGLDRVLGEFDRFAGVLPPRSYLQALRAFFVTGNRRGDCVIPRAVTGMDQEGVQAVCACGDLGLLGPFSTRLHRAPAGPIRGAPCRVCFTHYEILHHVEDAQGVRQGFTRRLVESYLAARGKNVALPAGRRA